MRAQLRTLASGQPSVQLIRILVPALVPLVLIVLFHLLADIEIAHMAQDITTIGGLHPLSGFLSSMGILLWWASACIWFSAAWLHRQADRGQAAHFAVASGAFSAYLAADDLFLVHERLAPTYLLLPEKAIHLALGLALGWYLVRFRDSLLRPDAMTLIVGFVLLTLSVGIDVLSPQLDSALNGWAYLIEDGSKWLGITCWFGFCLARCRSEGATSLQAWRESRSANKPVA